MSHLFKQLFSGIIPLLVTFSLLTAGGAVAGDGPSIPKAVKGEQCVDTIPNMRRSHMEYLKQHRVETLRFGIRTKQYSLKECINCHVEPKAKAMPAATVSHVEDEQHFCKNCHTYAGVKPDCFDCHATQPEGESE